MATHKPIMFISDNALDFRIAEDIARDHGYLASPALKPDLRLSEVTRDQPGVSGRHMLYLQSHNSVKSLAWDWFSPALANQRLREGYIQIKSIDELYRLLDNPPRPEREPDKLRLNGEYTAEVRDTVTVVGCQTFDNKVILELAELVKGRRE